MIKEIYQALKKRLNTETNLRQIDLYFGQDLDENMVWTTPSCFVQFMPFTWEDMGKKVQAANAVIRLFLMAESHYENDKRITENVVNAPLDHIDLGQRVYNKLQGWRCMLSYVDAFAPLAGGPDDRVLMETMVRRSSRHDFTLERIMIIEMDFQTRIYDYYSEVAFQTVLAQLQVDVAVTNQIQDPYA